MLCTYGWGQRTVVLIGIAYGRCKYKYPINSVFPTTGTLCCYPEFYGCGVTAPMPRNPRGAWSGRRAVSGMLLATTLLLVLPSLCDCWWWGASPSEKLQEETQDAVAEAIKAAEEAVNRSQQAQEIVQYAASNATAAEAEANQAEAQLTG
eukprot:802012-Rhodomonas_salina.1